MAQVGKTFRVFVSSTFTDLQEERNALQQRVFPRLRDLCMQHGCRFQAIDLRWGIREEAALDQRTMKICVEELRRCRKVTPRPNFIVLLGDRYGWLPVPEEIPALEFEEIQKRVPDSGRKLLDEWYRRDENAVPPVYLLQPRTGEYVDYATWQTVERRLHSILIESIEGVALEHSDRLKYVASATEQEIHLGALRVPDAHDHVYCFFRGIEGLPEGETAKDFIDLDEHGKKDEDARDRLHSLKETLRGSLQGNVFDYKAKWTDNDISTTHLDKLCNDVYDSLSRVITEEIEKLEAVDVLEKETAEQSAFGRDRARFFTGRASMLKTISNYIKGDQKHPLAIFGEGGSGKSALLAYAIDQALQEHPDAETVFRFIGATPGSTDGRTLLESLCRQLTRSHGADESGVPAAYEDLVKAFPERLALATGRKPLILFLDSLDQLSRANNAQDLSWLPVDIPDNVRLIVSTRPGEQLDILTKRLPSDNLIELEPMPRDEAVTLLDLWLHDAGRTLQDGQRKEVLDKFDSCGLPLYLKLAFEEARLWISDTADIKLSPSVKGIIGDLYERLSSEGNHGKMLVSHSLGYIASTREAAGLSEDEIIDILSADPEVFEDLTKRAQHKPPEQRLPVAMWSRFFYDLEPYLAERSAEGATLFTFYHRELGEVAHEEYLADEEGKERQRALVRYFRSMGDPQDDRSWSGSTHAISELPYHLTTAEMWDELFVTLTDFRFLENKAERVNVTELKGTKGGPVRVYGGVFDLQEDYNRALAEFPAS